MLELTQHIEKIKSRIPFVSGEESTKQSLVIPFLQVLGYDVFDPQQVTPEYVADFAVKKAGQFEKIDYAICIDNKPVIFVECKALKSPLDDLKGQLSRYFNATPSVKIGVITDGIIFKFFTDLREPNIMDLDPWLEINLLELKQSDFESLKKFNKEEFNVTKIISFAEEMVYYNSIYEFISTQFKEPSDSFVKFVVGEIPSAGRVTNKLVSKLTPIVKQAVRHFLIERISQSLEQIDNKDSISTESEIIESEIKSAVNNKITTTINELDTFHLIKKWIGEFNCLKNENIQYKDYISFFSIYLDKISKWFIRFNVQEKPYWICFKHLSKEDILLFIKTNGLKLMDDKFSNEIKIILPSILDLEKIKELVIAAYGKSNEN